MFDPRQELSSLRAPSEFRNFASHAFPSLEMLESKSPLFVPGPNFASFRTAYGIMMTWFKKHVREVQVCFWLFLRVPDCPLLFSTYLCRVLQSRRPRTTGESRRCSLHLETPVLMVLGQWQRIPMGYACIASCDRSYKSYMDILIYMDTIICAANKRWVLQKETLPTVCAKTNAIITIQTFYDLLIF